MSAQESGWTTSTTPERSIGGREITLEARAFRARLPFGGLVWNRPAAVRMRTPTGEVRLPLRDVTRRWEIAAYGLSLLCLLAGLSLRGRPRKEM